ncbi:hypothetical protein BDB01DRAFT_773918 [Pilobolus umbonatus]|nr:hypothetical protein BDB01DRAFT_773918 [Pilobolus umbonatus]
MDYPYITMATANEMNPEHLLQMYNNDIMSNLDNLLDFSQNEVDPMQLQYTPDMSTFDNEGLFDMTPFMDMPELDDSPNSVFMANTPITPALVGDPNIQWYTGNNDINDVSLSCFIPQNMKTPIDINNILNYEQDMGQDITCADNELFPPLLNSTELDTPFIDNSTPADTQPIESDSVNPDRMNDLFNIYMETDIVQPPIDHPVKVKTRKRRVLKPKPTYACSQCDKVFKRRFNLGTHELLHDPQRIKKFQCDSCSKRFDRKNDLDRHASTIHHKERRFACSSCTERFSRNDALKRHRIKKHS